MKTVVAFSTNEKEMTAKEFLKQYGRMCNSTSCTNCPLMCRNDVPACGCKTMLRDYPEKTLQIVQKWAEENPEKPKKTRLTEFKKMFPTCVLDDTGYPRGCVLNYESVDGSINCNRPICINCSECKAKFWNEEVKD